MLGSRWRAQAVGYSDHIGVIGFAGMPEKQATVSGVELVGS